MQECFFSEVGKFLYHANVEVETQSCVTVLLLSKLKFFSLPVLATMFLSLDKQEQGNAIREHCQRRGLRAAVVCSSGIACRVYDPGVASTVHSYYGLGAADLPAEQLLNRATSDTRICEKVKK